MAFESPGRANRAVNVVISEYIIKIIYCQYSHVCLRDMRYTYSVRPDESYRQAVFCKKFAFLLQPAYHRQLFVAECYIIYSELYA